MITVSIPCPWAKFVIAKTMNITFRITAVRKCRLTEATAFTTINAEEWQYLGMLPIKLLYNRLLAGQCEIQECLMQESIIEKQM
ncbi:MAG: hypothetical protein ACLFR1_12340 [Spirochaetia bacterium]